MNMILQRIHKVLICLLILMWIATPVGAGLQESREAEIKAAFLVQFSKYVSWPDQCFAESDSPIVIGILGRDPFGSKLDKISRSFKAQGRNIKVHRLSDLSNVEQCHVLYISTDKTGELAEIIAALPSMPIVLVSDISGFLDLGGIIHFITVGTKVRFNISLSNSKKIGLKISSKLLKVANKVE